MSLLSPYLPVPALQRGRGWVLPVYARAEGCERPCADRFVTRGAPHTQCADCRAHNINIPFHGQHSNKFIKFSGKLGPSAPGNRRPPQQHGSRSPTQSCKVLARPARVQWRALLASAASRGAEEDGRRGAAQDLGVHLGNARAARSEVVAKTLQCKQRYPGHTRCHLETQAGFTISPFPTTHLSPLHLQ